jgi:phosphatidate cytidylyltransferase
MKGKVTFAEVGELFLVSVYIVAAFNAIIDVRDFAFGGKYLYILIFAGAWITDIFAYFSGVLFGKHKLIPEVSPKKTIEGSIGGTLFCVISFIVFGLIVDGFFSMNANFIFLAISGLVVSILAQIGDLIMSVIKRHYNIKDYGKFFPGHGGILDRFDSVIAVTLILSFICTYFNLFA